MKDAILAHAVARQPPEPPCLSEEEILDFVAGALQDLRADEMREHLARCPTCGEVARDAGKFLAALRGPDRTLARRRRVLAAPLAAAATIMLALGAAFFLGRSPRPPLSIPEPPWQVGESEILFRDGGDAGASIAEAKAAWQRKAWSQAASALLEAWRREPRFDVASQRADALLLAGQYEEAAEALGELRAQGDRSARTLYRIALADLGRGRREDARALLQRLSAGDGPEAEAARRMLHDRRGLP